MKSFRSRNTTTKAMLLLALNFVAFTTTGVLLFLFTDILKNQSFFLTLVVIIFSGILLGTFLVKKFFIESYEYEFDEKQIIRKNLKSGIKTTYNLDQITNYFIASPHNTSGPSYIELKFRDGQILRIYVPPFSIKQTKVFEEFETIVKGLVLTEK